MRDPVDMNQTSAAQASLLGSAGSRKWVVALVLCHRKQQIVSRVGQMEGEGERWKRWIRGQTRRGGEGW